tara:strand:+ start:999 stop:1325 length:327 start_codon:yes stop_codon:yes gene_type:complete
MANTFKSVTSGSIGTTVVPVYTCPSSTTTIVLGASIANIASSPIAGTIKLNKNGGDTVHVVKQAPVPNGSSIEVMAGNKVVLEASDKLEFQSDTADSVDTIISLLEIT